MYLADVAAVLLRRWVVVLLGLLLTGSACATVIEYVEPDYQASGELIFLLPPEATGAETPTSPFLNFQSGMSTTASLVAGSVGSKDVRRQLAADGRGAEYAVALAPESGPLLVVTAKDKDPEVAINTRNAVMVKVASELKRIQVEARVPDRQLIRAQVNNTSAQAEVLPGSRLRALAGAAGSGMLLTLLLAFAGDRLASRRARIRARRVAEREETAGGTDSADDDTDAASGTDDLVEVGGSNGRKRRFGRFGRPGRTARAGRESEEPEGPEDSRDSQDTPDKPTAMAG